MRLALAGDTMLGRLVAERIEAGASAALFADDIASILSEVDALVVNLECAISDRGERWPDPAKPFFFRAPPAAAEVLANLGVDCVTLANNHALDYGADALMDTIDHLAAVGISTVGAGQDEHRARLPRVIERAGTKIGIVAVTDHPAAFAARVDRPGVAYADLRRETPRWLVDTIGQVDADLVVVSPHWGPNMVSAPVPHVRRAAAELRLAGAGLVAGHSAHVFHGVVDGILYDLGDFIDDYAIDAELRNDLGLLFIVTIADSVPTMVEAIPLALECCHTRLARSGERAWIVERFRDACAEFGTRVDERDGRLVIEWGQAVR